MYAWLVVKGHFLFNYSRPVHYSSIHLMKTMMVEMLWGILTNNFWEQLQCMDTILSFFATFLLSSTRDKCLEMFMHIMHFYCFYIPHHCFNGLTLQLNWLQFKRCHKTCVSFLVFYDVMELSRLIILPFWLCFLFQSSCFDISTQNTNSLLLFPLMSARPQGHIPLTNCSCYSCNAL